MDASQYFGGTYGEQLANMVAITGTLHSADYEIMCEWAESFRQFEAAFRIMAQANGDNGILDELNDTARIDWKLEFMHEVAKDEWCSGWRDNGESNSFFEGTYKGDTNEPELMWRCLDKLSYFLHSRERFFKGFEQMKIAAWNSVY